MLVVPSVAGCCVDVEASDSVELMKGTDTDNEAGALVETIFALPIPAAT